MIEITKIEKSIEYDGKRNQYFSAFRVYIRNNDKDHLIVTDGKDNSLKIMKYFYEQIPHIKESRLDEIWDAIYQFSTDKNTLKNINDWIQRFTDINNLYGKEIHHNLDKVSITYMDEDYIKFLIAVDEGKRYLFNIDKDFIDGIYRKSDFQYWIANTNEFKRLCREIFTFQLQRYEVADFILGCINKYLRKVKFYDSTLDLVAEFNSLANPDLDDIDIFKNDNEEDE